LDEITPAMAMLHAIGFIRAIAGALDCFGASVVGVIALRTNLLRADLDSARRTLAAVNEAGAESGSSSVWSRPRNAHRPGRSAGLVSLGDRSQEYTDSPGRRLQMSELRPVPSGIVGPDGRPVIRTDVIHQLPRDPGRSDVEMFLDATHPPVLTESAAMTLLGVLESTLRLIGEAGGLFT